MSTQRKWLAAIRAPRLGGGKLVRLVDALGGIEGVFTAKDATLRQAGLDSETIDGLRNPDPELLAMDQAWLDGDGHHLVEWGNPGYPDLLTQLSSPPAALFVVGDPDVLLQPQIAMIGSRNPTSGGLDNARDFAGEMARRGFVVTSGLASGIDSACHDAALDAGANTVAVTATGPDLVYPASSRKRAARIAKQGALVTEFAPGTQARREHFPSRNRIISGLSLGVLVIEAGLNSGTLITARLGSDQGRDIFALPGSIHNPMAKGCHRLIREGARLVETVDEIIEGITPMAGELAQRLRARLADDKAGDRTNPVDNQAADPKMKPGVRAQGNKTTPATTGKTPGGEYSDPEYQQLWETIGFDPKPVDRLVEQSGLTAREVSAMLLMLELRGEVEAHPGGAFSRKR